MKKNKHFGELFYRSLKKTLLIMRIAVILMILRNSASKGHKCLFTENKAIAEFYRNRAC